MKLRNFTKTGLMILLCGLLAACQTSGLKPGSIQTNYAPSGWTKKTKNGVTGYICQPPVCKSDRAIGYGPIRVSGNFEKEIKENDISAELFNAVANVYNVAAKGKTRMSITRRVVTKTYAGFDFSGYIHDRKGRVWLKGRFVVQENRGSVIFSGARSRSVANTYFNRYIRNTTIRRLP
ncbi:hypothetical protein IWQ54_004851 [Labrenzia sp. EL_195]|uniref:hypothetical protein n=1 Tax=Roseibium album TaxID=311410 RepID=UPI0018CA04BA|nr:hypothetical protein [Roseibium album]MBG6165162.1 hypothetical protein [Labrenzia sp. EL_195]MBG6206071.1 hypothetical protein [Labrenzia sp. EL_126]